MLPQEQEKLDKLYQSMVKALKRQGMSHVTVDTYSRAIIRIARYFDRCPDDLSKQDLKDSFDHFIAIRSWRIRHHSGISGKTALINKSRYLVTLPGADCDLIRLLRLR